MKQSKRICPYCNVILNNNEVIRDSIYQLKCRFCHSIIEQTEEEKKLVILERKEQEWKEFQERVKQSEEKLMRNKLGVGLYKIH